MLPWSKYFQNPVFLELTRRNMIPVELTQTILERCGIQRDSRVLDVGCGTGYFGRFLKAGQPSIDVTGVDLDETFLDYARGMTDAITVLKADALHLPFEDACFDTVVSHTFFTNISSPRRALREMMRVCKKGGRICAMFAMTFRPAVCLGFYPEECSWREEYYELFGEMWRMYEKINPMSGYANGFSPELLPHFFADNGLKQVSAFPVGRMFSLSDAGLSHGEREAYVKDHYEAERIKLEAYMELSAARALFSPKQARRYLSLLRQKGNYQLAHNGENRIWEWEGGASVLLTGETQ